MFLRQLGNPSESPWCPINSQLMSIPVQNNGRSFWSCVLRGCLPWGVIKKKAGGTLGAEGLGLAGGRPSGSLALGDTPGCHAEDCEDLPS